MKKIIILIGLLILCQYAFANIVIINGTLIEINGNDRNAKTLNIPKNVK